MNKLITQAIPLTTAKLKNTLTENIFKINDTDFLNAINVIVESKFREDNIFKLNDHQRKRIRQSDLQFKKGEGILNDKVFDKMEKWLKEK